MHNFLVGRYNLCYCAIQQSTGDVTHLVYHREIGEPFRSKWSCWVQESQLLQYRVLDLFLGMERQGTSIVLGLLLWRAALVIDLADKTKGW